MKKRFIRLTLSLFAILAIALIFIRINYRGGAPYPGLSTTPSAAAEQISAPISRWVPLGMVVSSSDGRIFYTY